MTTVANGTLLRRQIGERRLDALLELRRLRGVEGGEVRGDEPGFGEQDSALGQIGLRGERDLDHAQHGARAPFGVMPIATRAFSVWRSGHAMTCG